MISDRRSGWEQRSPSFPVSAGRTDWEELAVEGSHVLLLEMPFSDWSRTDIREVEALISRRGFQVVLAHLERLSGDAGE